MKTDSFKKEFFYLVACQVVVLMISLLLGQKGHFLFTFWLLVASIIIYSLAFRFIPHEKIRIFVCAMGIFLVGLPLFAISQKYEREALGAKSAVAPPSSQGTSVYQQVTSKMKKVTPKNFLVVQEEETLILYVGSETCPYCTHFIQKMQSVDVSSVYYMDTEEKTEALYSFTDKYRIVSIPQLLRIKNKEVVGRFQIQEDTHPEAIEDFLQG